MVTSIMIAGLLLAFVTGFFCAIKSVQVGLRWQMQAANKQEPVLNSVIAPITDVINQTKVDEANKYSKQQMYEWMHGEGV